MIDREQLQTVLGLSNIIIDRVVFTDSHTLNIYVTSTQNGCACHRCGQWITTPHGVGAEIRLRHLPMFEYRTEIILKPKRYRCLNCDNHPTTTQTLEWYTPRSSFTKAYEQELLRALVNSTLEDVSCKYDVSSDQLDSLIDRSVAQTVDWERFERLDVIGVDEISLKKGHRQYVTVVSALIDGTLTILAVLADRTKATVEKFFRSIPKRLRRTVRAICSDLYAGFINAAKAVFGRRVAICADRFHITKLYREGVESVRKQELKHLKKTLPKAEYESFKKAHWILRKSEADLTADERRIRTRLFAKSPKLQQAYALSQALTAIYESRLTPGQAKRQFSGWIIRVQHSQLTCFNRFIKTLRAHWNEVANYFIDRQTSGFVEGLNNKIKVLKRRSYGLFNPKRLFQRVYIDLHGYDLFAVPATANQ